MSWMCQTRLPVADHLEILNLYARYNHTIDAADLVAWIECFAVGGVLDVPSAGVMYQGADELLAFGKSYKAGAELDRHLTTNIEVCGKGSEARGRAYLLMCRGRSDGNPPTFHMSGRYEDNLRKTEDGWRFVTRILRFDGV